MQLSYCLLLVAWSASIFFTSFCSCCCVHMVRKHAFGASPFRRMTNRDRSDGGTTKEKEKGAGKNKKGEGRDGEGIRRLL